MAKIVEQIEVQADTSKANSSVSQFGKNLTSSFLKAEVAARALSKTFDVAVASLKKAGQFALEYEKTTRVLENSVARLGGSTTKTTAFLQLQAAEYERLTGHSDEVIRKFQAMGIQAGVMPGQLKPLLDATISISNAFGIDLNTAFSQLLKTQSGIVEETLGTFVPALKKIGVEERNLETVLAVVNEQLGNQRDVLTEGGAGAVVGLITAWDSLFEAVFKSFGALQGVQNTVRTATSTLQTLAQVFEEGGFVAGVGSAVEAVLDPEEFTKFQIKQRALNELRKQGATDEVQIFKDQMASFRSFLEDEAAKDAAKNKGRKPSIEFGAIGSEFASQEVERVQARIDAIAAGNVRQIEMQAELDLELARMEDARLEEVRLRTEEEEQIRKEALGNIFNSTEEGMQLMQVLTSTASQQIASTLREILDGQKIAGEEFLKTMLGALGQALFNEGVADLARAGAYLWKYGPAAASGLAGAALAEMATGAAIMSATTGRASRTKGGGGGGGGAGAFAAGGGGGGGSGGEGGGKTVIVNVNGAMSSAEAGREVREALAEASRQGL